MSISLAQNASPDAEDAKIAAGENVYNTYCQLCHGDRLVRTLGPTPATPVTGETLNGSRSPPGRSKTAIADFDDSDFQFATQLGSISIRGPSNMIPVLGTKASAGLCDASGKCSRHTRVKPR
jgi:hypothetical protein